MNKCFFIEVDSTNENISLVTKLLSKYKAVYFALWFYPETSKRKQTKVLEKFKNNFIKTSNLVPMTYYEGEKVNTLKDNDLFLFNNKSKSIIIDNISTIKKNCDSILFYIENNSEWIVGEIFHEKIILAQQNTKIKNYLQEEKISFSENPPDWW